MAESKEEYFLKFNIRNILTNAIQAEDHLRYVRISRPEHHSCVQKHLLFIRGELGEAISHASVVKPDLVPKFKELLAKTEIILNEFEKGIKDPSEAIIKIRELRRDVESIFKPYDTSKCEVCGPAEEVLKKLIEEIEKIEKEKVKKFEKKEEKPKGFLWYWEKEETDKGKKEEGKSLWYWERKEKIEKPKSSSVFNW